MITAKRCKERDVRKLATRLGYRVKKSKQAVYLNNPGVYQLVDRNNVMILGSRYDASLEQINTLLVDVACTIYL